MATKPAKPISAETDVEARTYELVGLIPGSFNEKETAKVVDEVKAAMKKAKAEIHVEDLWSRRPLAYPIRGQDAASYLVLDFSASPTALKGLQKTLTLESQLIRFSMVSMPADYRYVSLATLTAQAAEAKEALAPGLDAPTGAPRPRMAAAKPAAAKPVTKTPAPAKPSKGLDEALKDLDSAL